MVYPTIGEYQSEVADYAKIALELIKSQPQKLTDLVKFIDRLPHDALADLLDFAQGAAVAGLPDEVRLQIWAEMSSLVRKHRRHANAKWALPPEAVDQIDQVAIALTPLNPAIAHRVLFSNNTMDLHDDREDWKKNEELLAQRRMRAVEEIYVIGGLAAVLGFAESAENAAQVGAALGNAESIDVTGALLPKAILSTSIKIKELVKSPFFE